MFVTRLISGIVLLALIGAGIIIGGPIWLVFTGLLSLIATYELFRTLQLDKSVMMYMAFLADIALYVLLYTDHAEFIIAASVLYFILLMAVYVIRWPKYTVTDISYSFFSFAYAGLSLSYIYQVRSAANGIVFMWLIFISSWGSDTCAYVVGKLFGKHKVPSTLSPKKTIEGCIGGVLGSVLIAVLYGLYVYNAIDSSITYYIVFPVICMFGAVFSQIGDLAASAVKRNMDIKDYGRLIPGHGGIMDRFDSVIFIAPIIFYLMTLYQM